MQRSFFFPLVTCIALLGCGGEFSKAYSIGVGEGGLGPITGTSDPTNLWTANQGSLIHWDGNVWTRHAQYALSINSIVAVPGDRMWIAGSDATLFRQTSDASWNRDTSEQVMSLGLKELSILAASGPDDVWIGANNFEVLHWNGQGWSAMSDFLRLPYPWNAAGGTRDNVWVVADSYVAYWTGDDWYYETPPVDNEWHAVAAVSPDDVWVGGGRWLRGRDDSLPLLPPAIVHWDGNEWTQHTLPAGIEDDNAVTHFWVTSPTDIWAGLRTHGLLHFDGTQWTQAQLPKSEDNEYGVDIEVYGVWAFSANDVWASHANGVLHFDGTEWSRIDDLPTGQSAVTGMWGSNDGELFLIAGDTILRRDPPR